MTVLDSRSGMAEPSSDDPGVLITSDGVTMPSVDDIGVGRGPSWLDDWLERNAADVLAW